MIGYPSSPPWELAAARLLPSVTAAAVLAGAAASGAVTDRVVPCAAPRPPRG